MKSFPVDLSEKALAEFNEMLPWFAGTALPDGRVLGNIGTRDNKRDSLQAVPDKRIVRLHKELDLSNKSVFELGCFEGIHTLGLRMFSPDVTAIDIRPVNVLKTLARLSAYGTSAKVFQFDVEEIQPDFPHFDVVFHCGVLYHLEDPVTHLERLLPHCNSIYLDTHISSVAAAVDKFEVGGRTYLGHDHHEGGWEDPFSGRGRGAFWMQLSDIEALLVRHGFTSTLWSERDERNGPRIGLLARRAA